MSKLNSTNDSTTNDDDDVSSTLLVDYPVADESQVITTSEPQVVVPKNSLYINNRGYEIPATGLDVSVILADSKILVSDREKRKNFESVIAAIAGANGKLDLSEVSKLKSIAGIPVRFG